MESTTIDPLYQKLVESPLYQTYRKAFQDATGLSLTLLPADSETRVADSETCHGNAFCEFLNDGAAGKCEECARQSGCLRSNGKDNANTVTCFAGLKETAIPIRTGDRAVAYLMTGQVFLSEPQSEKFEELASSLPERARDSEWEKLKELWLNSPVLNVDQYHGMIVILTAFGLQLSELLNRVILEKTTSEPEVITKAKQYINARLDEKINLDEVAHHAGVSSYYFCKLFKQHTRMTLTEYVNRRRVEWAKQKLLDRRNRITEIAYDVGYQSLSQFNRSFAKYAGMSPSRFREQQDSERLSGELRAA